MEMHACTFVRDRESGGRIVKRAGKGAYLARICTEKNKKTFKKSGTASTRNTVVPFAHSAIT